MKASVVELPFNSFLGIQIATEPSQLLRLRSGKQYLNHLGTVHASAQLALAEASSGEFLLRHFGSADGTVPQRQRLPRVEGLEKQRPLLPCRIRQIFRCHLCSSLRCVRCGRLRWCERRTT